MAISEYVAGIRRSRRNQLLRGAVVLALAAMAPLVITDVYTQNILVLTAMFAALSQAWNILGGYCGQVSLGQAFFFGVGAYGSTVLTTMFGINFWPAMLVGGVLAAAFGLLVGWPTFKLRGHYFVIATIVIAEAGYLLFLNWDWVGGATGIFIPFVKEGWANFQFQRSKLPFFYVALAFAAVLWLVTFWIERSKWGFYWRAVKDNADAAESLGVRIFPSKMAAAGLSAFFTGCLGCFYAQFVSFIDPESFMNIQLSLLMTLPAVLGGLGTLWGPAVGAVILIPITELTRSYVGGSGKGYELILYGLLIMVISTLKPEGLVGIYTDWMRKRGHAKAAAGKLVDAA